MLKNAIFCVKNMRGVSGAEKGLEQVGLLSEKWPEKGGLKGGTYLYCLPM